PRPAASRRWARLGVAAVLGVVLGGSALLIVQQVGDLSDSGRDEFSVVGPAPPTTTGSTPTTVDPGPQVVLAWTAGGLPAGFGDAVGALATTRRLTIVRGDPVEVTGSSDGDGKATAPSPPPGLVLPL